MQNAVVARLGDDPSMAPLLASGDLVLLDSSGDARVSCDADALYAVEHRGRVGIRWIRCVRRHIYLLTVESLQVPTRWEAADIGAIRARAIPLRSMYPTEIVYDPLLPPRDTLPAPAQR